jgi:hypothetical protein
MDSRASLRRFRAREILLKLIIFRNIERDGPKGRKGAGPRRKEMQGRQEYARGRMREILQKNPTLKPDDLAYLIRSKGFHVWGHRTLVDFIRRELKALKAGAVGSRESLKLVRG